MLTSSNFESVAGHETNAEPFHPFTAVITTFAEVQPVGKDTPCVGWYDDVVTVGHGT